MSDVVIGDLNINIQDANSVGEKQLQRLGDQIGKKPVLNEITHQNLSQPDHILLGKDFGLPFYATSYKNMYSDHNSISFRFANSEAEKLLPSLKQQLEENYVRSKYDSAGDQV